MRLTDSHAHLTGDGVYEHVDALIARAQAAGVSTIVNICTDVETLERGLLLAKRHPCIYNVASTTPHDVAKEGEEVFPIIRSHALAGHLVAIGETGLDYHYTHSPQDIQKDFLRRYLHLAIECKLPVVIHCREAFSDLFEILDREYVVDGKHQKGVLHCFTGTVAEAEEVFKRGWYLSISGIATFKKSTELREVIRIAPLDQLLIETDTPFLAPQSHRGKPNEPAYIVEIAQLVADIKGISLEAAAAATTANASRFLGSGLIV
jgi:TatD DNase family protein